MNLNVFNRNKLKFTKNDWIKRFYFLNVQKVTNLCNFLENNYNISSAWFQNIVSAKYEIARILIFFKFLIFYTLIFEFHLKINNYRIHHLIPHVTIHFFIICYLINKMWRNVRNYYFTLTSFLCLPSYLSHTMV